jgi:hypothetical protein
LKERTLRGHSICVRNEAGNLEMTSTDQPYDYGTYERIVSDSINSLAERDEMIRECHLALLKTGQFPLRFQTSYTTLCTHVLPNT